MEGPSSSQASSSHSDLEAMTTPVKCEFPNETTVTLQNHKMTNNLPKEQKIFSCSDSIEPFRCFPCTKFETYNLVDLKSHFKTGHTLFEFEKKCYTCRNCNFQTYSKYLILKHDVLKTCVTDGVKSEHAVPEEVGELQFLDDSLIDSKDIDSLSEKWLKCDDDNLEPSLFENHVNLKHFKTNKIGCGIFSYLESHWNLDYPSEDTTKQPKFEYCTVDIEEHNLLDENNHCTYKTESNSVLNDHASSEHKSSRKKYFKCGFCPYLATRTNDLKRHIMYRHTAPDKIKWFECEDCSYKCKGSWGLKTHVERRHGKNVKFKCDNCEFEVKSKQGLQYHILAKHRDPKWFHCEHCPYKTKRKCYLKTHFHYKHGNQERIKCDHCEFETKFKQSLKNHVLVKHTDHSDMEWFACEHCSYKSKKKKDLKAHMDYAHGNKAKLKCGHCEFETKFKHSLKCHVLLKHTDPDKSTALRCEHCPYLTTRSSTLKRHVLLKHADPDSIEWFHCTHCSYKGRVKTYLENHILMRHHQT